MIRHATSYRGLSSWLSSAAWAGSLLLSQSVLAQPATEPLPPPPQAAPPAETPVTPAPVLPTPIEATPTADATPLLPSASDSTLSAPVFALNATDLAPSAPTGEAKADESGFALTSGGKKPAFAVRFKALVQVDNRKFLNDDRSKDTVLLRRARPILDGTVLGLVDFRVMPDFAGSQASLVDAYLDAHPFSWLRLRVGKYKSPIGLERLQGDPDMAFMERALSSNLSPTRDVGIQLWGDLAGGVVSYAVGVFDGASDNGNIDVDTGAQKDLVARLFFQPFKAPGLESAGNLGIGIAGSTGRRDGTAAGTQFSALRSVGQQSIFSYLSSATDPTATAFAKGRHNRLNPELYYYNGGFGLLADVIWSRQHVQRGDTSRTLGHRAWHATVSYVIGGKNGFDGATPTNSWNPDQNQFGALEIGVRYQELKLDDDTFPTFASLDTSVRRARGFGVSLNWTLSRMFRVVTGFEHTWFDAGRKGGVDRKNEDVWLTRAQVNF